MPEAKITIRMDNAAFVDDGANGALELARILREIAICLEQETDGRDGLKLRDANGNTVGAFEIDG